MVEALALSRSSGAADKPQLHGLHRTDSEMVLLQPGLYGQRWYYLLLDFSDRQRVVPASE